MAPNQPYGPQPTPPGVALQAWLVARLRPLSPPPAALRAACLAAELAVAWGPVIWMCMADVDPVPVFLVMVLLWVSLCLKIWLRALRAPSARQQLAAVAQGLAEPRKRCARGGPLPRGRAIGPQLLPGVAARRRGGLGPTPPSSEPAARL
jgi:hypothetical protein